jgi:hypothetical protein
VDRKGLDLAEWQWPGDDGGMDGGMCFCMGCLLGASQPRREL